MFCINCGERIEVGERFCIACGQPAEVQAAPNPYSFEAPGQPPVQQRQPARARRNGEGAQGAIGAILAPCALGAALFAAICAALAVFALRATVGGGMLAAFAGIPSAEIAAVAGDAGRAALLTRSVFAAAGALVALFAFDIFMPGAIGARRAFVCVGAASGAAGLLFALCGLIFGLSGEMPLARSLAQWPMFDEFGQDACVYILRTGLAALAASALAFAARAMARERSSQRARGAARAIAIAAVNAVLAAAAILLILV